MKHFKKILAPTDFSAYSDEGLRYADFLAGHFGSQVLVLHVLTKQEMETKEKRSPPLGYRDEIFKEAERESLDHYHRAVGGERNSAKVNTATAAGVPFVEIIRKAREEDCDLIVMSTHGRTGLNHVMVGSVAENVVRMADCPVLTLHPEEFEHEQV